MKHNRTLLSWFECALETYFFVCQNVFSIFLSIVFSPFCTFRLKVNKNPKNPHHTRELTLSNVVEDCGFATISPTVGMVVFSLNRVSFKETITVTNLYQQYLCVCVYTPIYQFYVLFLTNSIYVCVCVHTNLLWNFDH